VSDPIIRAAEQAAEAMHAMWQQVELLDHQLDFSQSLAYIGAASDDSAPVDTPARISKLLRTYVLLDW
jgi:hypothetical protein